VIRQLRIVRQQAYFSRSGLRAVQHDSLSQLLQSLLVRDALDVNQIDFREFVMRIGDVMLPTHRPMLGSGAFRYPNRDGQLHRR